MNEQQQFWSKEYGKDYIRKNLNFDLEKGVEAWEKMLVNAKGIGSALECGSNIGRNIAFTDTVIPEASKSIIEINDEAFKHVIDNYKIEYKFNGPIVEAPFTNQFDLVYIMGVLIHIHPDDLLANMTKMFQLSSKYILIGEYFNRTPTMIRYQGEDNKLFKMDFGKLFLENFDVKVVDYGFLWGVEYDVAGFDDITWWLFEK